MSVRAKAVGIEGRDMTLDSFPDRPLKKSEVDLLNAHEDYELVIAAWTGGGDGNEPAGVGLIIVAEAWFGSLIYLPDDGWDTVWRDKRKSDDPPASILYEVAAEQLEIYIEENGVSYEGIEDVRDFIQK